MATMKMFEIGVLLSGLALWSACGAGAGVDESEASEAAPVSSGTDEAEVSELTVLAAGSESRELGVSRWEIAGENIRGTAEDNRVVAEFEVQADAGLVESLVPAAGVLSLDGSGSSDSFSPEVRRLFDAFQLDRAQLPSTGGASVQPSVLVTCNSNFTECNEGAAVAISIGGFSSCTCTSSQAFPCGLPGAPAVRLDCF